jgi:type II secretory pathway component GspD/PulD (secretin)
LEYLRTGPRMSPRIAVHAGKGDSTMKPAILWAAVALCALNLNLRPRSGVAATKTSESRGQRAIAIEVLIVRTHKDIKEDHTFEFSGPSEEVAARVRELQSDGRIDVVDRVRLTTVENQKVQFQAGRVAPVVSGRSFVGRGVSPPRSQLSYDQKTLGTLVSVVARVDVDAIVVELQVEKSQLERHAGSSKPDDEFVPLATETLTTQVTLRIRSGKTVLAGSLEKRADAESSAQLVLASARVLEPSLARQDVAQRDSAKERTIRIFSLQRASAKGAAAIIKGLVAGRSGQITVSVDPRTNSLIVRAEDEVMDVLGAILLELDKRDTWPGPQPSKEKEKSGPTHTATKYDKMKKNELQGELKRLQKAVLDVERTAKRAAQNATEARRAYESASDDEKADALLRMIEVAAASRKAVEPFKQVRSELDAAERAYSRLLTSK